MDLSPVEKRRRFIIHVVFFALVLVLAYLFLEYVLAWIMPFLLGFIISLVFQPLIRYITKVSPLNKRFVSFVVVILGYVVVGLLLWGAGTLLFRSIKDFCMNLPTLFAEEIAPFFVAVGNSLLSFSQWIFPDTAGQMEQLITGTLEGIQASLGEMSTNVLGFLASASTRLPLWLISFIFTILSSLFISMDYDHVIDFIKRQIPEKSYTMITDIRDYLGRTVVSYLKAYMILMCITFVELSVGLLILRIDNPFGIAALIAICDVMPILGTGTVVIPWALISLMQQQYYLAIGLLLLYLIITAVRHLIEPKVIGDQLGIAPIVALICIYLGFVWFGVWGAILFPVLMNIILSLQKAGKIHVWK